MGIERGKNRKEEEIRDEGREIARKRESRKENQINPKKKKNQFLLFFSCRYSRASK